MNTNQGPDCLTCWRRNICPQAEEGKFCFSWQTAEPVTSSVSASADTFPSRGRLDLNDLWNRGEDAPGL